jgi:hypothetical protein
MYSYRHFRPGSGSNTAYIINYVSEYNRLYGDQGELKPCYCMSNKYDKNTPGAESSSSNMSYARRLSQIMQQRKGGKSQYGSFYLGQPLNINYLGRIQGMPGGSGAPPTNKF